MEPLNLTIGENLNRIRKDRGLSLDKLAEISGVSKGMLGLIERGESNPTVATLWKIASGLRVPFTALLRQDIVPVQIVSRNDITPVIEDSDRFKVFPYFTFNQDRGFEMFIVEMMPGCIYESGAHNKGVEEYIFVFEGTLELLLGDRVCRVPAGDAVTFAADVPHIYQNKNSGVTRAHMIIRYQTD